jgi:RNA-directed DNA polymerase
MPRLDDKSRMSGDAHVRFRERLGVRLPRATRLVAGFQYEADARHFWEAMRARLEQFALTLHPDKTRLLEFGRRAAPNRQQRGLGKPETFTFLGFIFICGKSRQGRFLLQRKTRGDRLRTTLREVKDQLRRRMHEPIPAQGRWLKQVVTGFFAYHAVPTNARALSAFRYHVIHLWRRTLRRRSQKDGMSWERMARIADAWLPRPRILHPWPERRFAVKYPRWEPSARIAHAGICAGGAR